MWSILIIIGGIDFGSQYMSKQFFLSYGECEQAAVKMTAAAPPFPDGNVYTVRCEPFKGLLIEPWRVR